MASSSSLGPYVGETPNGEAPEMLECLPDDTIDCKYCGSIVEAGYWSAHLRAPHHREKVGRQYRARQWETVRAYPDGQFLLESNYIELGDDNQFCCTLCNKKSYGFGMIIESHCASDKHKRNVEWAARTNPPPTDRRLTDERTMAGTGCGSGATADAEYMRAQRLKDEEGWIVCKLCNKKFFDLDSAKGHCASTKHAENVAWDDENRRLYNPEIGELTVDGQTFLRSNYLQISGTTFNCPMCDKQFYDIGEARVHCDSKAHVKAVKWKNSDNAEQTDEPDYDAAYNKQFYRMEDGQRVATVAGVIASDEDSAPCNYPNEQVNDGYLICEVCDVKPQSWDQWKGHLHSKKHLSRRAALDEEYVCYWQRLHAGGVAYYYEHISQIWQWGEVADECMRVKFRQLLINGSLPNFKAQWEPDNGEPLGFDTASVLTAASWKYLRLGAITLTSVIKMGSVSKLNGSLGVKT
ncbi:hypothetical protein FOZ61_011008, partial [Perkinsus olseni]